MCFHSDNCCPIGHTGRDRTSPLYTLAIISAPNAAPPWQSTKYSSHFIKKQTLVGARGKYHGISIVHGISKKILIIPFYSFSRKHSNGNFQWKKYSGSSGSSHFTLLFSDWTSYHPLVSVSYQRMFQTRVN